MLEIFALFSDECCLVVSCLIIKMTSITSINTSWSRGKRKNLNNFKPVYNALTYRCHWYLIKYILKLHLNLDLFIIKGKTSSWFVQIGHLNDYLWFFFFRTSWLKIWCLFQKKYILSNRLVMFYDIFFLHLQRKSQQNFQEMQNNGIFKILGHEVF